MVERNGRIYQTAYHFLPPLFFFFYGATAVLQNRSLNFFFFGAHNNGLIIEFLLFGGHIDTPFWNTGISYKNFIE